MDISIAATRLKQVRNSGAMTVEVPTPERVLQAGGFAADGGSVEVGQVCRSVEMERDGQRIMDTIKVPRLRVDEDTLKRLASRLQLDPDDEVMNRTLHVAGERYRNLHYKAGLEPIQGQDPTRGFTAARRVGGLLSSESSCDAFQQYVEASDAVTYFTRRALDDVVLKGAKLESVGYALTPYEDKKIRAAIALTYLRIALRELAKHFEAVDATCPVLQ